jgi:hypothetical protein
VKEIIPWQTVIKIAWNVQAFVLLGTSSIRRPRRRLPNVIAKDKILFCCSTELRQTINPE